MQEKIAYFLINPTTEIVFWAPSYEIAASTVILWSQGKFGAEPIEEQGGYVPIFLEGGAITWFQETFGRSLEESFLSDPKAHAETLETFHYADADDEDRLLGNENDHCFSAHQMAAHIRTRHGCQT